MNIWLSVNPTLGELLNMSVTLDFILILSLRHTMEEEKKAEEASRLNCSKLSDANFDQIDRRIALLAAMDGVGDLDDANLNLAESDAKYADAKAVSHAAIAALKLLQDNTVAFYNAVEYLGITDYHGIF